MGLPVNNSLIIRRALYLKKKMNINTTCKFSNGWIKSFKRRYNIVLRKGCSKIVRKDDCILSIITDFIKLINEKIESGEYTSIIDIDETGLYYDF